MSTPLHGILLRCLALESHRKSLDVSSPATSIQLFGASRDAGLYIVGAQPACCAEWISKRLPVLGRQVLFAAAQRYKQILSAICALIEMVLRPTMSHTRCLCSAYGAGRLSCATQVFQLRLFVFIANVVRSGLQQSRSQAFRRDLYPWISCHSSSPEPRLIHIIVHVLSVTKRSVRELVLDVSARMSLGCHAFVRL